MNEEKLTFEEELQNVIDCMKYWEKRVGEYVMELNEVSLCEDECVMEDTQKALEFIRKLPEIISGACVLAVYAGEDWASDETGYGFGADSYEFCDKYIEGGMELADVYGTEDFHNDYSDYFRKNICPITDENKFNDNEKNFIEVLNEAMRYIRGELELNNVEGDWYALDYREDLGSAFNIDVAPYDEPLITDEEAYEKGIDVRKCCDYVGAYIIG